METLRGEQPPSRWAAPVVTLGVFDGVHRGHQTVLSKLLEWRRETGRPAGILTFAQHPRAVREDRAADFVTTLDHRLVLFQRAGVDFTWVLDFTPELSQRSAEEFARLYLAERLGIHGLLLGFDSRFGRDRVGADTAQLEELARRCGFEVRTGKPVCGPDGQPISSTRLREAISEGDLPAAEALLGRRVSVYGRVVRGAARGRRLGYPTANLDLGREVRPPFGVYATLTDRAGGLYGSLTNVGYRPTVAPPSFAGGKPDLLIETHLFDFSGDLYDRTLEVHFVEKLRDERRFPDVQTLAEQIRRDEEQARRILGALGPW